MAPVPTTAYDNCDIISNYKLKVLLITAYFGEHGEMEQEIAYLYEKLNPELVKWCSMMTQDPEG